MYLIFKIRYCLIVFLLASLSWQSAYAQQDVITFKFEDIYYGFNHYGHDIFVDGFTVWVATNQGAIKFDGTKWRFFDSRNGWDSVYFIGKDAHDKVWFSTRGRSKFIDGDQLVEPGDSSIIFDQTGETLWARSSVGSLFKIGLTGTVVLPNPEDSWLYNLEQDSNGKVWASSRENFFLQGNTWIRDTGLGTLNLLHIDSQDNQWAVNSYGKIYCRPKGLASAMLTDHPFETTSTSISVVKSDEVGTVYFGTWADGVLIKSGNTWTRIDRSNGLLSNRVLDMEVDQQGNVWVVDDNGISVIVNNQWFGEVEPVRGKVFSDVNNDGVQNQGEVGIPGQFIKLQPGKRYAFTDSNGNFSIVPSEGENTITALVKGFWEQGSTPLSFTFNYPTESPELQIGLKSTKVTDVAVEVTSSAARPGFNVIYFISVRNEGTTAISTKLTLDFDPSLTFLSSTLTPSVSSTNHLEWQFNDLQSLQRRNFPVYFKLSVDTPLGAILKNPFSVSVQEGEIDLTDNADTLNVIVTGSFDPNDKLVAEGILEERFVELGSTLNYTIRFQNTGTDTAFVVKIKDELDPHFDLTSLEVLASSHTMTYALDNRYLTFTFQNIKLPDSTRNEPASHGYVKYRIKPYAATLNNTRVTNTADIYFDFNEPVRTNEVSNTFVSMLPNETITVVEDNIIKRSILFPNPARGELNISNEVSHTFHRGELFSSDGRKVKGFLVTPGESVKLNDIPPGLYLVRLFGNNTLTTTKIIIAD